MFLAALGPEAGQHARALFGVERLPMDFPIEITATFTVRG
jgi:enamine deaminase RidA (YjgF/YER057c/UK114 family)